jgi:uncharacterized integral membrane protein (TIGR00698 family)
LIKENYKGILLAVFVAFLAQGVKIYFGYSAALVALTVGIVIGNLVSAEPITPGTKWVEKHVLSVAIILIGAGFNLNALLSLPAITVVWILLMVFAVFYFAKFIGKFFNMTDTCSTLLGAGSAICGSAAIMASARVVQPKSAETGLTVGVVNLLGTIGIFILPTLGLTFNLDVSEMALLTGGTLQSMGHVVAAGFAYDTQTGELATVVKMARISLLIPFLIWLSYKARKNSKEINKPKIQLPYFIPGFLALVVLSIIFSQHSDIFKGISKIGELLIIPSMAAIGLNIRFKSLLSLAPKAIFAGVLVFAFQLIAYGAFILLI